jgi:GWxTD domain-containing protein
VREALPDSAQTVTVQVDTRLNAGKPWRLRAMIFQLENTENDELADRYRSIYQQTVTTSIGTTEQQFEFQFDLRELVPATYLIEVFLLGDSGISLERQATFRLPWYGYTRILNQASTSFQQLSAIYPISVEHPHPNAVELLAQFWHEREGINVEQATFQYYQSVAVVDTLFAEPSIPGTQTDRGQTYLAFGPPINQEYVRLGNQQFLLWKYPSHNYARLFKLNGSHWNSLSTSL